MPKVPNTDTFSLQDVINAVEPTTNDLQDCVNDANVSLFNPGYYSNPVTSMLEFRDYGVASTSSNYDSIRITITNNTSDGTYFWIRTAFYQPPFGVLWIGQAMHKYNYLSTKYLGNRYVILEHIRPFTSLHGISASGYENIIILDSYRIKWLGYGSISLPIYGIWRFDAGTSNITLTAVGYKGGVATTIDSISVSPPPESIQDTDNGAGDYMYNAMGSQLAVFEYNTINGSGYFDTPNNYNYRGGVNTSGTKSSSSSSTTLKGNLFFAGSSSITEKGFVYKTTNGDNLEIGQTGVTKVVVSGTSLGTYEYVLSRSTDIYYRSYCINSVGTQYSDVLLDSLDGLGDAGLPSKVEINSITRSGSTITVNWDTVDSGEDRSYVLLTKVNNGNYELSLNGPQTDGNDTYTVNTTGVYYYFIVRCFNGDSGLYLDSEEKYFYVS